MLLDKLCLSEFQKKDDMKSSSKKRFQKQEKWQEKSLLPIGSWDFY